MEERRGSVVHQRLYTVKLRRRRAQATRSFYDNNEDDENEHILSKWTIVRQRLPDILALSENYKPSTMRAQLVFLVALMNKQANDLANESRQSNRYEYNNTISHIVPSSVIIDISGRRRLICLKRIPPEQVIHVDVDNLSFSIPTRQFILAISRGSAQQTAAKYCPPAISDMLIDISKAKLIDDRRQYKRAQFKMRLGQMIFFVVFIVIISMVLALVIAATNTIFKFDAFNSEANSGEGDHSSLQEKFFNFSQEKQTKMNFYHLAWFLKNDSSRSLLLPSKILDPPLS